jgi:hypothetical protein
LLTFGAAQTAAAAGTGPIQFSLIASGLYGHEFAGESLEDPHGAGLGLGFGVTLPVPIYVGLSFSHFFGVQDREVLLSDSPVFVSHDSSITQLLWQMGYDGDLKLVRLRPNVGLGFAHTSFDVTRSGTNSAMTHTKSHSNDLMLSPGLEVIVPLGLVAVCAQIRYDALPNAAQGRKVLVFGGGLGVGF